MVDDIFISTTGVIKLGSILNITQNKKRSEERRVGKECVP